MRKTGLRIKRALPHLTASASVMMLVLYVIDRINPAMHFIGGNEVFNTFLFIFSLLALLLSITAIVDQRRV